MELRGTELNANATQFWLFAVARIVTVMVSCILLASCYGQAPTYEELEEEVDHLAKVGMPFPAAVSGLRAAGFDCSDAKPIPEGSPFPGFVGPVHGSAIYCERVQIKEGITCPERLLIVISDKETSTISIVQVELFNCLALP
jgi:hypothetical protein